MHLFLITALVCAALLAVCWRLAASPVNGPALAIASSVVLVLLPAWLYLRVTHTTVPEGPAAVACGLYLVNAAALVLGYAWALRRPTAVTPVPPGAPAARRAAGFAALALVYVVFAVRHVSQVTVERPFTRAFYAATRLGYGNYLLTAEAAAIIAVLLALVYLRGPLRWAGCAAGIAALAAFGSKGAPLTAILIVVYFFYLRRRRIRLGRALVVAALGVGFLYAAFWVYSPQARNRLGMFFLSYSSAARNLVMEVANWHSFQHGGLTWSDNLYVLVPRALVPSKPVLFGQRLLAARYYYGWVMGNTGDPSFGQFGLTWADFGPLAFLLVAAFGLLQGALLGILERRLKIRISFPELVAYLTLAGMLIISGGDDDLVIIGVNIAIGVAIGAVMAIRLRPKQAPVATAGVPAAAPRSSLARP